MPTSLDTYLPYDSGAGSNVLEDGWRSMGRHWLESGVLRGEDSELAAFGDSSGLQVKVPTGKTWLRGQYGENTSQKTIPIGPNASGSTRIDRVILRNDFVNNRIELDVLPGTPGAGVPLALTQNTSKWELSLAQVTVTNGAATITAGNVVDERLWAVPRHGEGGEIGYAEGTANQLSVGTAATDWTGLAVTVVTQAARRYRITIQVGLNNGAGATNNGAAYVREGATTLGASFSAFLAANATNGDTAFGSASYVVTPSAGIHTYKVSGNFGSGAANKFVAAATTPAFILVEDIGPA